MNRGIAILVAVGVFVVAAMAFAFYERNYTCSGLRDQVRDAKALRADGDVSRSDLQAVEDAARKARSRGCDISDLVGDNVGRP